MRRHRLNDPFQVLRLARALLFSGLAMMLVTLMALHGRSPVSAFWAVIGVLGVVDAFGGLIFAVLTLKCPFCGQSLMLGGRLPSRIPDFCPGCGTSLEEQS